METKIVCFTDINKFHDLSQNSEIEIADFLHKYYQFVGDKVISLHGKIIKYMGDSVLSIFPPDNPQYIESELTLLCHDFEDFLSNQNITTNHYLMVGLAMGEIELIDVGHSSLIQHDVFGLTVNHAAMACKKQGVSISPESVVNFG